MATETPKSNQPPVQQDVSPASSGSQGQDNQDSTERAVEASQDPQAGLEKARNAAEGKADNAAGGAAASTAAEHVPSTSDPEASDLPSSGRPMPD